MEQPQISIQQFPTNIRSCNSRKTKHNVIKQYTQKITNTKPGMSWSRRTRTNSFMKIAMDHHWPKPKPAKINHQQVARPQLLSKKVVNSSRPGGSNQPANHVGSNIKQSDEDHGQVTTAVPVTKQPAGSNAPPVLTSTLFTELPFLMIPYDSCNSW